ncbi:MAG: exodeoxyribonuclease VII large subunit [Candidatus Midichloriaceae bacterium]|jgi:exodeoxyribonuclease VII large subunit
MFLESEQITNEETVKTYSITEISLILKKTIESTFSDLVIKGEISGIKIASSGHVYFSLKDQNSVLNAICWRGVAKQFPLQFEEGMEIICKGGISTYPGRSNYQIIVKEIKLAGEGLLLAKLEERKKRLEKNGFFDEKYKKAIPRIPKKVGVITSLQGAVIKDILHRLKDRFPVEVLIWDVIVQGNEAAGYITEAIERMNDLPNHITPPDVIIVARGGGSIEDLWAFNEELVVNAVFKSKIPIVSAIGHETDTTLIDMVADLRAPTPTAAAEFITPDKKEIINNTIMLLSNLNNKMRLYIRTKDNELKEGFWRLTKNVDKIQKLSMQIESLKRSLKLALSTCFKVFDYQVGSMKLPIFQLERLVSNKEDEVMRYKWQIEKLLQNRLDIINNHLISMKKLLFSYNPQNILKKGYAIITDKDGDILKSSKQDCYDTSIEIKFYDGIIKGVLSKNKINKKTYNSKKEPFNLKIKF